MDQPLFGHRFTNYAKDFYCMHTQGPVEPRQDVVFEELSRVKKSRSGRFRSFSDIFWMGLGASPPGFETWRDGRGCD